MAITVIVAVPCASSPSCADHLRTEVGVGVGVILVLILVSVQVEVEIRGYEGQIWMTKLVNRRVARKTEGDEVIRLSGYPVVVDAWSCWR